MAVVLVVLPTAVASLATPRSDYLIFGIREQLPMVIDFLETFALLTVAPGQQGPVLREMERP